MYGFILINPAVPALTFYFFCVKEKESKKISFPFGLFPK